MNVVKQLFPTTPTPTLAGRVGELEARCDRLEADRLGDQLQMALMQGVLEKLNVRLALAEAAITALKAGQS